MAVSDVSICNRALHKLGASKIISLDDNNEKGRVMSLAYEPVRRAELRRNRWKFSITRASLPALSDAPLSDYDYQYQLPNDFLRLLEGGDLVSVADLSDYRSAVSGLYSVEGGKILTNLGAPLNIRYIRDVTDAALFDSAFVETFACRLAFETVERITESSSKKEDLGRDYKESRRDAARANALESPPQSVADDAWVMARAQ